MAETRRSYGDSLDGSKTSAAASQVRFGSFFLVLFSYKIFIRISLSPERETRERKRGENLKERRGKARLIY